MHLGFQVNSFKQAHKFYEDQLGFDFIYSSTIGEFKHIIYPEIDPASDTREQMCYVRVAEGQYLELFEGVVTPENFDPQPIKRYENMPFIEMGLEVADLKDAAARLKERGLEVDDDACVYDEDKNCYRLIETGGPVRKHIITGLAYVAMKVNDLDAAVKFYTGLGLNVSSVEEGKVMMKAPDKGGILLVASDQPVKKYTDVSLGHMALATDSLEDMRISAVCWEKEGIPPYRNVDKKDIIPTEEGRFNPDQGFDGTIGMRIFDPDDMFIEVVYLPEENLQRIFEREHPFD